MPNGPALQAAVERYLEYSGEDEDIAHEMYDPVAENLLSYDGGPWMFGVVILEFQGEKVARERIYVMDPWEAPEWRAPWRSETPADETAD